MDRAVGRVWETHASARQACPTQLLHKPRRLHSSSNAPGETPQEAACADQTSCCGKATDFALVWTWGVAILHCAQERSHCLKHTCEDVPILTISQFILQPQFNSCSDWQIQPCCIQQGRPPVRSLSRTVTAYSASIILHQPCA